jgi:Asp-tRNA(Asn)/Glu-tRNA(Gln) amidotransferase B subunit
VCSAVRLAHLLWEQRVGSSNLSTRTIPRKEINMKIDLNDIRLVSPKQNAEIVKMISDGTISGKQAKELLTIVIDMNVKQIEEFLTKNFECCKI